MIAGLLLLLLAAPPGERIALRVLESSDLPLAEALAIASALGAEIEARTAKQVVIDEPTWPCEAPLACEAEVRARTGASTVVLLRIFGGALSVHVEAARPPEPESATLNLPVGGPYAGPVLTAAVTQLFPEAPAVASPGAPARAESAPDTPWLAYGVWGGAVVAAGFGLGFGLSNQNAADQIGAGPLGASRYQDLADRQQAHGIAADACWSLAVGGLIGGAIIYWLAAR